MRLFENRREAASELAGALSFLEGEDLVVLAVSNGGVPVAEVVATRLRATLDILLLTKLTAPRMPAHVVGAVDEFGRISLIETTARWHHLTSQKMIGPAREAFRELGRRRTSFRAVIPEVEVRGKVVVVVNDGVSDGASMLAAIASVRDRGARRIIIAAPAGPQQVTWQLHKAAHTVVIPHTPSEFKGVDKFYRHFPDITDGMAIEALRQHAASRQQAAPLLQTVTMHFLAEGERTLYCEADMPPGDGPFPTVIFAHGFDSDARSSRSMPISHRLAKRGVIGARLDFCGHGRSDGAIKDCSPDVMLSDLRIVFENLLCDSRVDGRRIGLCGGGMGALVALRFAALEPRIRTLVARGPVCGGEVEAAGKVNAPTLIIHAEGDTALADDVHRIDRLLGATHELLCIPDCNRLFNDPISMELMASATVDWLADHLRHVRASADAEPAPARRAEAPAT